MAPSNTDGIINGLVMVFAKPSLRTRLSFEIGMQKLGGNAIFYTLGESTLGKKESIKDFSKVVNRYADVIMARLYAQKDIEELARYSSVPVINGLTDDYHPCQTLGDLFTIIEKHKKLKNLKIVYLGDANNNVTHSLIIECDKLGVDLVVSCPNKKEFLPNKNKLAGSKYKYEKNPLRAVKNADIIYTDTWMSYEIPKSKEKARVRALKKFQVNEKLFNVSRKALFMHCLPAKRGQEVTDEVMDSKRSIVYDQAENRMWIQMAIMLKLMKKKR